ncbi:MAG: response regulator [Kofleriaceae bacterium]|nr:response regulator [Kofleriaceae bacterium]
MSESPPKRVFVMDDSPFALELTRGALAAAGLEVTCARDLHALPRLDRDTFDLVLMDVEMPEAFGDDVATMFVGDGRAPVYLLSSLPGPELEQRARECGATGYIEKQLGIAGVVACVRSILGVDGAPAVDVPSRVVEELLSAAVGRIRRAEGALARGEPTAAAASPDTLAAPAALHAAWATWRGPRAGVPASGAGGGPHRATARSRPRPSALRARPRQVGRRAATRGRPGSRPPAGCCSSTTASSTARC